MSADEAGRSATTNRPDHELRPINGLDATVMCMCGGFSYEFHFDGWGNSLLSDATMLAAWQAHLDAGS